MSIGEYFMEVVTNAPMTGVLLIYLHFRLKAVENTQEKIEEKVERHNKFNSRLAVLEADSKKV